MTNHIKKDHPGEAVSPEELMPKVNDEMDRILSLREKPVIEYQEISREIIREYGGNLLVKVIGIYMEKYRTTAFEHWTNRGAFDRRQKADGNKVFCMNLAEREETVLADWACFIASQQARYKGISKYTCAECGYVSSNEFLDRCPLCCGQIPNHD